MDLIYHLTAADGLALLLALAVKGSLLFLLAFLVVGFLRRASAATRHAVWTFALAAAFLMPVLFVALPGWQVPVLPAPAPAPMPALAPLPPMPSMAPMPSVAPVAPVAPVPPVAPAPSAAWEAERKAFAAEREAWAAEVQAQAAERRAQMAEMHAQQAERRVRSEIAVIERGGGGGIVVHRHVAEAAPAGFGLGNLFSGFGTDWRVWLVALWAAGAAVIAMRWVLAVLGAWRLVQHAEPVYDLEWLELKERIAFGLDLDRPVRLLRSDRVTVPIAGGVLDPVVVLPADADEWDEERREVVLTHEMAHIVRRDCLTQTFAQGALALHWFNPLAWMSYRRFMLEREHACDDFVLNHGARASDYAQHLVQIAQRFRRESLSLAATAPMARRSNLEGRILSILDPEQNRDVARMPRLAAIGALVFAFVAPLAAFQPVESAARWAPETASLEVIPLPSVVVKAPRVVRSSSDTFQWEGRVRAGGFVEVQGVNGSFRARTGSGDRVRVEAEKKSDRGLEETVEIVVNEFANGVVVCAIYPGQRDACEPGGESRGNVRDNDVQVTFDIVVPENVRFVGRTINGSIKTEPLGAAVEAYTVNGSIETASRRGDVDAVTVNGSIRAEAGGVVSAKTVNGSIHAHLGRADWDGAMDYSTTNGSITLYLPDGLDANVSAKAGTGSIKSDFPIQIRRTGHVGSRAEGRIGSGGRQLNLDVLNGSIKLRRASGATGFRFDRDRDDERLVERNLEVERDWEREVEREHQHMSRELRDMEVALAELGPTIQLALAEAGEVMAEIDFGEEIARAMDSVDWDQIGAEMEAAFAEAEVEIDANFEEAFHEAWELQAEVLEEIEDELDDARDDLRDELADVRSEMKELKRERDELSQSQFRAELDRLRAEEVALEEALCKLDAALESARERHDHHREHRDHEHRDR